MLLAEHKDAAKAAILHFIIRSRAKLQGEKLPTGWVKMMDVEDAVMQGYPLLEFLYEKNNLTQAPEISIKLPGFFSRTVYGAREGFEDITCGEFESAEIHFNHFNDNPNPESLAKLAAVLWRTRGFIYKTRKPFFERKKEQLVQYESDKMFKHFIKLAPWRLYSIYTWYSGSRSHLPLLFPTVHEKHGDSETTGKPDVLAFTKCIHAGAGVKNGNRNEIRMCKLFEFMFEMEQEAIKAKDLKAMYDERNQ